MAAEHLLTVDDLQVQFFTPRGVVRAVDGVSFEVGFGEAIGIVGESGSGKSMTALALLQLVPEPGQIVGGRIEFDGKDLRTIDNAAMRAVRLSDIGMIFQDASSHLNPIMTIGDQIAEAFGRRGSKDSGDRERVLAALRAVQIPEPARVAVSYPHELSGGMKQRALIASVLVRNPRLIIADEPTTALDATVQHQILRFLATMRASSNTALILISHDLAVVAQVCDRVYVMYAGQIIEEGRTRDIFDAPRHPYTRALLESILDPFDPKSALVPIKGSPPNMAEPPAGCRFHPRCEQVFDGCERVEPARVTFSRDHAARCRLYSDASIR